MRFRTAILIFLALTAIGGVVRKWVGHVTFYTAHITDKGTGGKK
ncbi:MAG TPA: hypothetical protein VJO35_00275 [Terriglobales bacterium]|nr:hypothetical protein [Terriglobales bacterium]